MATPIGREGVARLVERGAQLVEVLAVAEYEAEHLPGALNVPLRDLAHRALEELDRAQPIIVYCHDSL
jgi:rhodanese-related sulfurtransferase